MKIKKMRLLSIAFALATLFLFNIHLWAVDFNDLFQEYHAGGTQVFDMNEDIFFTEDLGLSASGLILTIDGKGLYTLYGSTFIADPTSDVEGATKAFTATGFNLSYSSMTIKNSTLTAINGAVYVDAYSFLEIVAVSFTSNSSTNGKAGAIYNVGRTVIKGGTSFIGNGGDDTIQTTAEGAIYNLGNLELDSTDGDIIFKDNKYYDSASQIPSGDRDIYNTDKGIIEITGNDNKVIINSAIMGSGKIIKTGEGELVLNGGGVNFSGKFIQTAGTTTVSAKDGNNGSFFGGSNYIFDSWLRMFGTQMAYAVNIGSGGFLYNYESNTRDRMSIYGSYITFISSGGYIEFNKDEYVKNKIQYNWISSIGNGEENTVVFNYAILYLATIEYLGKTHYIFNNSIIDLLNPSNALRKVKFDSLEFNNTFLNFNVVFTKNDKGFITILSDKFFTDKSVGNLIIGAIKITGDHGLNINDWTLQSSTINVLGGAVFAPLPNESGYTATTEHLYRYTVIDSTRLYLETLGKSSGTTLRFINEYLGNRTFNFSYYSQSPVIYTLSADLGKTQDGAMWVLGFDTDASHGVISGAGKHSLFVIDSDNVDISLKNLTISGAFSTSSGAALNILNSQSTITINNVIFTKNVSQNNGGAIFNSGHNLDIDNSIFTQNRSSQAGGAIYINESSMSFQTKAIFSSNSAGASGGAVYVLNSILTFIQNTTVSFSSNQSGGAGGVFFLSQSSAIFNQVFMTGYFRDNKAKSSGGVFYSEDSFISFGGNLISSVSSFAFVNNSAGASGGVFYLYQSSAVFNDSVGVYFIGNTALSSGGAVYLQDGYFLANQGAMQFIKNKSEYSGGALFVLASSAIFSGNVSFLQNNSLGGYGGAIYAVDNSYILFANSRVDFSSNSAKKSGGAIFINQSTVSFNGESSFNYSSSSMSGGAVYIENAFLLFKGAVNFNYSLALSSGGALFVKDSVIDFNSDSNFRNSTSSLSGGSIFMQQSTLSFYGNVTFEFSKSSGAGGALYALGSEILFMGLDKSINFRNSFALSSGGALYVQASSVIFSSVSAYFENNVSSAAGGAIYLDDAYLSFDVPEGVGAKEASWSNNMSESSGGAVFARDSVIVFSSVAVTFSANVSTRGSGGAMYLENSSVSAVMEDREINISNNSAFAFGGALYLKDSYVIFASSLQRGVFNNNTAGISGGFAFINEGSTLTIARAGNTEIQNNVAVTSGGAIYNAGTLNLDISSGNITFNNNKISTSAVRPNSGNDLHNTDTGVINIIGSSQNFYISFEGGITGSGTINQDSYGTVNFNGGANSDFTGTYNQSSGAVFIRGSLLANNEDKNYISGGLISFESGSSISSHTVLRIGENAAIRINSDKTFNEGQITGLDEGSGMKFGTMTVAGGNVFFHGDYGQYTGDFIQTGGNVSITSQVFGGVIRVIGGATMNLSSVAVSNGWDTIELGRANNSEATLSLNIGDDQIFVLNNSGDNKIIGFDDEISSVTYGGRIEKTGNGTLNINDLGTAFTSFSFTITGGTMSITNTNFFGGYNRFNGGWTEIGDGVDFVIGSTMEVNSGQLILNYSAADKNMTIDFLRGGGTIQKISSGTLYINDVNSNNNYFSGRINNSKGMIISSGAYYNYTIGLATETRSFHYNTTTAESTIRLDFSGTSATAVFAKHDGGISGKAKYNLNNKIESSNGGYNEIIFQDSIVRFGSETNFIGSTTYIFRDSYLDLSNGQSVRTILFDNIKTDNVSLIIGVDFDERGVLKTDRFVNSGQENLKLGFGQLRIYDAGKVVNEGNSTVLSGGSVFVNGSGKWATTEYEYNFQVQGTDLSLFDIKKADGGTLRVINETSGTRGFNFSSERIFAISTDLGETSMGDLTLSGFNSIPSASVLSGAGKYSFFRVDKDWAFISISNLTISDAFSLSSGAVVYLSSSKSSAAFNNTILSNNNSYSGGAVYVQEASGLSFNNTQFSSNTAISSGGAVYVLDANVQFGGRISFSSNTALDGGGGAMFVSGSTVTFNSGDSLTFSSNTAFGNGGAFAAVKASSMIFEKNILLTSNTAIGSGGAVYFDNSYAYFRDRLDFIENLALGNGGGAAFINNSSVTFNGEVYFSSNVSKANGGALYLENSDTLFASNANFTGNFAEGKAGALYIVNTTTDVKFNGSVLFDVNSALDDGGAIYARNVNFDFSGNVNFTTNTSQNSGGAFNISDGTMTFRGDTRFMQNTAISSGGAAYINQSSVVFVGQVWFSTNTAGYGAALNVEKSFLQFSNNVTFEFNTSTLAGSGLNNIKESSMVFSGDVNASYNSAAGSGGVFDIDNSYLEFGINRTLNFSSNSAAGGGGAMNIYNSSVSFYGNLSFNTNTATGMGGSIKSENSLLYFSTYTSNLSFSWGFAQENGGAWALINSEVIFDFPDRDVNIYFEGNTSSGMGGALYSSATFLHFSSHTNISFINNASESSGTAIALFNSSAVFEGNLSITDNRSTGVFSVIFMDASTLIFSGARTLISASTYGYMSSAIHAINGSSVAFIGQEAVFENFKSTAGGIVLYSWTDENSKIYFSTWTKITATGNEASSGGFMKYGADKIFTADITLNSNIAQYGGAFYIENGKLTFLGDNTIFNNNISTAADADGGAVYLGPSGEVDFSSTTLTASGNEARNGGFMYLNEKDMIFHKDVTLSQNKSRASGGALYISLTTMTFDGENVSFEANQSTGSGGAIYSSYSFYNSKTQKQDSFSNNTALEKGGALYSLASTWTFNSEQTVFSGNSAKNGGGAIYALDESYLEFNYLQSWFGSNASSNGGGGAIFSSNSHIVFNNDNRTVFYQNISNGNGGAIYADNSNILFSNGDIYFQSNISSGMGGAIYATNGSTITLHNTNFNYNYSHKQGGAISVDNNALLDFYIDDNKTIEINGNGSDNVVLFGQNYSRILNGIHIGDKGKVNFNLLGINSIAHVVDTISSSGQNSLNIFGKGIFNLYLGADVDAVYINEDSNFNLINGAIMRANSVVVKSSSVLNMGYSSSLIMVKDTLLIQDQTTLKMSNGASISGKAKIDETASLSLENSGLDYVRIDNLILNGTLYVDAFSDSSIDQIASSNGDIVIGKESKLIINNVDLAGKKYRRQYYIIFVSKNDIEGNFSRIEINGEVLYDSALQGQGSFFKDYNDFDSLLSNGNYNIDPQNPFAVPSSFSSQIFDGFHILYNSDIVDSNNSMVIVFDGDERLRQTNFKDYADSSNQESVAEFFDKLSTTLEPSKLDYMINRLYSMDSNTIQEALANIAPFFMMNIFLSQTMDTPRNDVYGRLYRPNVYNGNIETWARAQGGVIDLGTDDNSPVKFRNSMAGTVFGLEKYDGGNDMILGVLGKYHTNSIVQGPSDASINTYSLGGYAGIFRGETDIKTMLGFGINTNETHRALEFLGTRANAEFYSYTGFLDVEAGQSFDYWLDGYIVRPFAGAYVTTLSIAEVKEKDADVLSIRYKENTFIRSAARFGIGLYGGGSAFTWNVSGSMDYILTGQYAELDGKFQQDSEESFRFRSVDLGSFLFGINLNTNYEISDKVGLYLGLNYNAAIRYESYSLSAGIKYYLD
jgi:predicted outer membrane repeat protein